MKKCIQSLVIFAFTLVASDWSIAWCIEYLYDRMDYGESGGKINMFVKMDSPPCLTILGSSRAVYHIDPSIMSVEAYNLGHSGQSLPFHAALLDVLLETKSIGQYVLLHLDGELFAENVAWDNVQFLSRYYGSNQYVTSLIQKSSKWERLKYWSQLYKFNGRIGNIVLKSLKGKNNHERKFGYKSLAPTPQDSAITYYALLKSHSEQKKNSNFTINNDALQLIIDMNTKCNSHGVKMICFTSPRFGQPLRNDSLVIVNTRQSMNELGIPYFDFVIDNEIDLLKNPFLWHDSNHLNDNGAKIFTQKINSTIKDFSACPPK